MCLHQLVKTTIESYDPSTGRSPKAVEGKIFFFDGVKYGGGPRMIYRIIEVGGPTFAVLDVENLEKAPKYDKHGKNLASRYLGRKAHGLDIEIDKAEVMRFMADNRMNTEALRSYKGLIA